MFSLFLPTCLSATSLVPIYASLTTIDTIRHLSVKSNGIENIVAVDVCIYLFGCFCVLATVNTTTCCFGQVVLSLLKNAKENKKLIREHESSIKTVLQSISILNELN